MGTSRKCTFTDCGRELVIRDPGLCASHLRQWRLGQELTAIRAKRTRGLSSPGPVPLPKLECTFEDCRRPRRARGYCATHYDQHKNGRSLQALRPYQAQVCPVPGCSLDCDTSGMCRRHARQTRLGLPITLPTPEGQRGWFISKNGYKIVQWPGHANASKGGQVPEHVIVMGDMLGRPLLPGETVHHLNGVRDDNSPENLELWVKRQPAGQRPEDVLAWARKMVARYGDADEQRVASQHLERWPGGVAS